MTGPTGPTGASGSVATDAIWDAAGDTVVGSGANTAVRRMNNDGAAVAPAVTDDSGDGYAIGSRWLDTTADKEYVALDVTAGAAVWVETTAAGGGGMSYGADVATAATFTATNSDASHGPTLVNDGNDTTYWSNGSTTFPVWLLADFGAGVTKAIRKIVVYDDGATTYGVPSYWIAQYSDDASAWYGVGPAFAFAPFGAATNAIYWRPPKLQVVALEDVGAHRYWRLYILEARNSAGATADWVRVRSVYMYESA